MQSPEQIAIDKAVRELRYRLAEENDIITTVVVPLIEEAVIQSRKSRLDEFGLPKTPEDPKEII